MLKWRYT